MLNDCVTEAALYVLLFAFPAGAVAVILHRPAPVMVTVVPLTEHGCPLAGPEKLTASPELDVALTVKGLLPYCTLGNAPRLMDCDCVVEPCGRIMKLPDAGVAAL
jgi:hypothetical protein